MSPEGFAAAKRRIELSIVDASRQFAQQYGEIVQQHNARGVLRSTMTVMAIAQLCEAEFASRASLAWSVVQRVIDSEGWIPTDANRAQIRELIGDAVLRQSPDILGHYTGAQHFMPNAGYPKLEDKRVHAVESAMADAEIDLLGRQTRRPPLIDELSAPRYLPARAHWLKAISLSSQDTQDLPNAVKEAVSCLESIGQIVVAKNTVTLGEALKVLRSSQRIPAGADKVIEGLWTLSNQAPGARHGSSLPAHIDPNHWSFVRTVAEGGIRLLLDIDAG